MGQDALPFWASELALGMVPEIQEMLEGARDDYDLVIGIRSLLAEAAARGHTRARSEKEVLSAVDSLEADVQLQKTWVGRSLYRVREDLPPLIEAASAPEPEVEKVVELFKKLLEDVVRVRSAILSELDTEPSDAQDSSTDPHQTPSPNTPAPAKEKAGAGVGRLGMKRNKALSPRALAAVNIAAKHGIGFAAAKFRVSRKTVTNWCRLVGVVATMSGENGGKRDDDTQRNAGTYQSRAGGGEGSSGPEVGESPRGEREGFGAEEAVAPQGSGLA